MRRFSFQIRWQKWNGAFRPHIHLHVWDAWSQGGTTEADDDKKESVDNVTTLIKLQAAVRGLKARKIFCIKKVAVRKLQYFIRRHICEKVKNPKEEIEDERQMGLIPSVIKLQAAIRRFMAHRIF